MSEDEDLENEHDADDSALDVNGSVGLPPVDFNLFVLSLNGSALIHLGEAPDAEGALRVDLPLARHNIDMLCMLEEKTRGNLTGEEERLLHQILFDLRMRFTHKARATPGR